MILLIFIILEGRHRLQDSHFASSLEISMYFCVLLFLIFMQTVHTLAAKAPNHVESTPG